MEKQSAIVKALQAALDELEILVLEGENLDLDMVEALMARFNKIEETRKNKSVK